MVNKLWLINPVWLRGRSILITATGNEGIDAAHNRHSRPSIRSSGRGPCVATGLRRFGDGGSDVNHRARRSDGHHRPHADDSAAYCNARDRHARSHGYANRHRRAQAYAYTYTHPRTYARADAYA